MFACYVTVNLESAAYMPHSKCLGQPAHGERKCTNSHTILAFVDYISRQTRINKPPTWAWQMWGTVALQERSDGCGGITGVRQRDSWLDT